MSLPESTPLIEFVTDLDSRISYDVNNLGMFANSNYELTDTDDLFFIDRLGAPDVVGRSFHKWRIRRLSETLVEVTRQSPQQESVIYDYTITDGLSSIIPLPGSEASFRFRGGEIFDLFTLTRPQLDALTDAQLEALLLNPSPVSAYYRTEGYARPERDLGTIAATLKESGAPFLLSLFGVGTVAGASEPFKTFRNLWNGHPELAYQLGGLLLAIIYRTEETRTNG